MASTQRVMAPPRRHRGAAVRALQASGPALGIDAPSGDHLAEIGSYQRRHGHPDPAHRPPIALEPNTRTTNSRENHP